MSRESLKEHFRVQETVDYRYFIYDQPGDAKALVELEDCEVAIRIAVALGKPVYEHSYAGFSTSIGRICDGHPPWRWVGVVFSNADLFEECDPIAVATVYNRGWKMSDPRPTPIPRDFAS